MHNCASHPFNKYLNIRYLHKAADQVCWPVYVKLEKKTVNHFHSYLYLIDVMHLNANWTHQKSTDIWCLRNIIMGYKRNAFYCKAWFSFCTWGSFLCCPGECCSVQPWRETLCHLQRRWQREGMVSLQHWASGAVSGPQPGEAMHQCLKLTIWRTFDLATLIILNDLMIR